MALIIWLLAPADWLTPSAPLPLLNALPVMALVAFIERSAGVVMDWRRLPLAEASVPIAMARLLTCCCWSPAAWFIIMLPL
ncbi:hypothetical protein D3C84_1009200 [compost metagenome]